MRNNFFRDAKVKFLIVLAFIALGLVASAGIYSSPQDAVRPQKPLQHEVSVTLKLIQVFVTDKTGKPVLDLTKDDFILYDDGRPQKLTEFEKHVLSPLSSLRWTI